MADQQDAPASDWPDVSPAGLRKMAEIAAPNNGAVFRAAADEIERLAAQPVAQAPACSYPKCTGEQPADGACCKQPFTSAMADAAERYWRAVGPNAHPLPAQFRWADCFRAMEAAAPSPEASNPAQADPRCAGCDISNGCPEYCRCKPGMMEREAFEQWARSQHANTNRNGLHPMYLYESPMTQAMWKAWEARAAFATQPLEKHPDSLRCIEARNKLNAAMYGEGALIDDLEHAVASACVKLATQPLEQKLVEGGQFTRAWLNLDKLPGTMMQGPGGLFGPVPASTSTWVTTSERERDRLIAQGKNMLTIYTSPQPEQVAQRPARRFPRR